MAVADEDGRPQAPGPAAAPPLPRAERRAGLKVGADGAVRPQERFVPAEVAVALVHDGSTTAVMMATPDDLHDFAVGFSLTERIVATAGAVRDVEVVPQADGVEVRIWLAPGLAGDLAARRRAIAGPTGCGLCGVDSLAAAVAPVATVATDLVLDPADVAAALKAVAAAQTLGRETRATHAAALWSRRDGLIALREDVGRHNALDKLVGAAARAGRLAPAAAVVVTSRVSVEMVQKTAALGAPVLIAVSAPTTLAIRTAEAAGITLVAVARDDGFEIFTRPDRIRVAGAGHPQRTVDVVA